ncbi:uncharacterized protein LOC144543585 [Carex rostrata]
MAKAKFLLFLTRRGSSIKSSSNGRKKDVSLTTDAALNETDATKIREEVLMLLNNFPESESESDRELSFSFLLCNSSPEKEKDDVVEKGGKTEDQLPFSFSAAVTEKKQRKFSRSGSISGGERIGVLLNLHVPSFFIKSRSSRVTPCTTPAKLEKREEEFNRAKCWPTLLRRKQDHSKLQLEVVKQLTC